MAGAIALAGMACLRSGAGLVRMAVPDCILDVVAGFEPGLMTLPLPADSQGRLSFSAAKDLEDNLAWADVVALGPGLGRSPELTKLVAELWAHVERPMVVDADALFALAELGSTLPESAGPRIITPHAGEFARLRGEDSKNSIADVRVAAAEWGAKHNSIVVLKGPQTLVTDGRQHYENHTGNPGMATGGTGDVLTGVIAALLGQKLEPFFAAALGAHVHGLAGDHGAAELGQVSLIASDLLRFLPTAFLALDANHQDSSSSEI